ncbi:hypothetical protein HGB07_03625 [Candidatus Roizmanbacteria bacterium]|nr:hypothetical protein [Candidatus Roizmanbacteria bacterium]
MAVAEIPDTRHIDPLRYARIAAQIPGSNIAEKLRIDKLDTNAPIRTLGISLLGWLGSINTPDTDALTLLPSSKDVILQLKRSADQILNHCNRSISEGTLYSSAVNALGLYALTWMNLEEVGRALSPFPSTPNSVCQYITCALNEIDINANDVISKPTYQLKGTEIVTYLSSLESSHSIIGELYKTLNDEGFFNDKLREGGVWYNMRELKKFLRIPQYQVLEKINDLGIPIGVVSLYGSTRYYIHKSHLTQLITLKNN